MTESIEQRRQANNEEWHTLRGEITDLQRQLDIKTNRLLQLNADQRNLWLEEHPNTRTYGITETALDLEMRRQTPLVQRLIGIRREWHGLFERLGL